MSGAPMEGGGGRHPYVPESEELTELTPGAIILGMALGLVFAASSVYLALRISLTVSASIPVAVLSITIFRYISRVFGASRRRSSRTTSCRPRDRQANRSPPESSSRFRRCCCSATTSRGRTVAAIAFVGGILGVLLHDPAATSLIVKEHANLQVPRRHCVRQVLIVGEQRGVQAKTVFHGLRPRRRLQVPGLRHAPVARGAAQRVRARRCRAAAPSSSARSRRRSAPSSPASATSSVRASRLSVRRRRDLVVRAHPGDQVLRQRVHRRRSSPRRRSSRTWRRGTFARTTSITSAPARVTAAGLIASAARCRRSGRRSSPASAASRGPRDDGATRRTERDMPMNVVVDRRAPRSRVAMVLLPQIHINVDRRACSPSSSPSSSSRCRAASPDRSAHRPIRSPE